MPPAWERSPAARIALKPRMKASTFEQPLPNVRSKQAASGHNSDGAPIPGRWHTYPEMAAAGLWTTAAELMRFGSELRKSALGQSNRVLTKQTTESMLTSQHGGYGLGVALSKQGARGFSHGGANAGYRCFMIVLLDSGNGVVIMTNGDRGDRLYGEILQAVLRVYSWPFNRF